MSCQISEKEGSCQLSKDQSHFFLLVKPHLLSAPLRAPRLHQCGGAGPIKAPQRAEGQWCQEGLCHAGGSTAGELGRRSGTNRLFSKRYDLRLEETMTHLVSCMYCIYL